MALYTSAVRRGRSGLNVGRKGLLLSSSVVLCFVLGQSEAVAKTTCSSTVEQVEPGSAAKDGGLLAGDSISSWERNDSQGELLSPFDLAVVELEYGPRGPVTLIGQRGNQQMTWILPPKLWGLIAKPCLPSAVLDAYEKGRSLLHPSSLVEAANHWQEAATRLEANQGTLSAWFWWRIAQEFSKARLWDRADLGFNSALKNLPSSDYTVRAVVHRDWAVSLLNSNKFRDAETQFEQAIHNIRQATEDRSIITATILGQSAAALGAREDLKGAEDRLREALTLCERTAPESSTEAGILNSLAVASRRKGDSVRAAELYQRSLSIRLKINPESLDVAQSLYNLGVLAADSGDLAASERYATQSLVIRKKLVPASVDVIFNLNLLGNVSRERGNLVRAEEFTREQLRLAQTVDPNGIQVPASLNRLGLIAYRRGDLQRAQEFYWQAIQRYEDMAARGYNAQTAISGVLSNLGNLANNQHDLKLAEELHRRALTTAERVNSNGLAVAIAATNLARTLTDRGQLSEADKYLRAGLDLFKKISPNSSFDASAVEAEGNIAMARGDLADAEKSYRKALSIRDQLIPGSLEHAQSLYLVGKILRMTNRHGEATQFIGHAIEAIEWQAGRLGGDPESKARYRSDHMEYYRDYLALQLAQGNQTAAFDVWERSRARSLLDMLAERDLLFPADVPADLQRERKLNAVAYDRVQSQLAGLDAVKDRARVDTLLSQLRKLTAERAWIEQRIKEASPRYAQLQYPEPLSLQGVRQSLDSGTTLLSYAVGSALTTLFVVYPAGIEPGLTVIQIPMGEEALRNHIQAFRGLIRQHDLRSLHSLKNQSRSLFDLLISPAESLIEHSERLLIIPDGPLHVLPFAALIRGDNHYFIEWKPLHTAISATVYAGLQKRRNTVNDFAIQFAGFGDPRYGPMAADERGPKGSLDIRSAIERGAVLQELPFSRMEIQTIGKLYEGTNQLFLGPDATEERAKSFKSEAKYIDFAAHGLIDKQFPLNSGIVLTVPKDDITSRDNGFLQAWEIYEQVHWDADLVTLSSCDSGLGEELAGEGLIGLTRAIQYAGARSVLASLWSVDDRRTAEFMIRFYTYLRKGETKDQALRKAQIDFLRSPLTARPVYWAAFSLNGDWR